MEQQLYDNDDDDSYVMVDFEDFAKIFSDSDKLSYASDNSSTEVEEAETSSSSPSAYPDEGSCLDVDGEEEMLSPISNSFMETNICQQEPDISDQYDESVKNRKLKDIVKFEVLPLLPAKLLLKFRSVSRDWDSWISSPFLAHRQSYLHTDLSGFFRQSPQYSDYIPADINFMGFENNSLCGGGIPTPFLAFLPQAASLINATHGLLLCRGSSWQNQSVYYVCNPLTTQYRELPKSNYFHERESAILVFEPSVLNFDADYKVVAAHSIMDQPFVFFEIYSSKENAWRCSETFCFELKESVLFVECFYMKGHVYWQTSSGFIVAFDLKTEHCGVMSLPAAAASKKGVLAELQGELSYIQIYESHQSSDSTLMDIYQGWNFGVMKSVELPIGRDPATAGIVLRDDYCRVLQSVQGEILMILCEDRVYSYHLRKREVVMMNRDVGNQWDAKYLTYMNSLVTIQP